MPNHRATRVAEAIKTEVADLLLFRLKDTRVDSAKTTVVDVEVSGDLRHATIYISVLGDEQAREQTLAGLRSASGYIRSEIGKALQLRAVPEPHFKLDRSIEQGANITALLNRIKAEQESGPEA